MAAVSPRGARRAPRRLLPAAAGLLALQLVLAAPAQAAGGDLDPSFGTGGKVVTDFDGFQDEAWAVAVQPDGNIVAAGNVGGLGNAFALARYLPDGRLDRRFGDRGTVTIDVNGGGNGNALVIQADGKLVAAGSGKGDEGFFALARYMAS